MSTNKIEIKMSMNQWNSLGKTAYRKIDPIRYKGWTFEAEQEEEDDCRKWYQIIKNPAGQTVPIHFSPYETDQVGMFRKWVDAGSPSPSEVKMGLSDGSNIMRNDLENYMASKVDEGTKADMERLFGMAGTKQKLKFAQFNQVSPLEAPERHGYDAEQQYKEEQMMPPFDVEGLAKNLSALDVRDSNKVADGMELLIEHTDGKLYLVKISPFKG